MLSGLKSSPDPRLAKVKKLLDEMCKLRGLLNDALDVLEDDETRSYDRVSDGADPVLTLDGREFFLASAESIVNHAIGYQWILLRTAHNDLRKALIYLSFNPDVGWQAALDNEGNIRCVLAHHNDYPTITEIRQALKLKL